VKILLKQDVPNLGKAGEVKTVADGYARNYLIPRGIAVVAGGGVIKQAELEQQIETRRQARLRQETQTLATALEGLTLAFHVRAGENDQLYGSITNADIAEALEQQVGRAIDRRKIELEEPIRRLGSYRVPIRLGDSEIPHIGVVVQRQEE
jgi:large subunit ribosomal protein L9